MIVAGVVVETLPGAAPRVATALASVPGLKVKAGDGHHRLAAVWTGPDGDTLERLASDLLAAHEDLLGIYPTFVGESDEME